MGKVAREQETAEGLYKRLSRAGVTTWQAIDMVADHGVAIAADTWAEGYAAGLRDQFNAQANAEYGSGEAYEATLNPYLSDAEGRGSARDTAEVEHLDIGARIARGWLVMRTTGGPELTPGESAWLEAERLRAAAKGEGDGK